MTNTNETAANTSNTEDAARILDLAFAATHGYVRGRHCDACDAIGDLVLSADLLLCACCVDRPTINTTNTEELERRLRENQLESLDLETEFKTLMSEARRLMEQEKTTLDLQARSKLFSEIKGVNRQLDANVEARTHLARTYAVIRTELGHRMFKVL